MPNASGVNRRRKPPKKEEPRFLRKPFLGYGRGAPTKILKILGWALALWFVSAILFDDSGLFSIVRMRGMERELDQEIAELALERDETEAYRDALEDDPEAIEKVAREEYGMIKDGEIVYLLPTEDEE